MKHLRRRRSRHHEAAELNITAFMNLMVILVPFLLITAVFSRLAILELNLPGASAETPDADVPELALEITVRRDAIEVGDRNAGVLTRIENSGGGYDYAALGEYLARVKGQFPDKTDATVLLEPDVPYQVLIEVMDRVRVAAGGDSDGAGIARAELFPDISIGDALSPSGG